MITARRSDRTGRWLSMGSCSPERSNGLRSHASSRLVGRVAQPRAVPHDEARRQGHCTSGNQGIEQTTRSEWKSRQVVDAGPGQIAVNRAQRPTRKVDGAGVETLSGEKV